jgi:hypothetical protein
MKKLWVPDIAKACRLLRRESLEVYYSVNKFVFIFSCFDRMGEIDSITSLRAVATFVGQHIKLLRPQALEIRFVSADQMQLSTLRHFAVCFAMMHANGLKPETDVERMTFVPSIYGNPTMFSAEARPILDISIELFKLGILLAQRRCCCRRKSRSATSSHRTEHCLKRFECGIYVKRELRRMILCKKFSREVFLRPEIKAFMQVWGYLHFEVSQVCMPQVSKGCLLTSLEDFVSRWLLSLKSTAPSIGQVLSNGSNRLVERWYALEEALEGSKGSANSSRATWSPKGVALRIPERLGPGVMA